MEPNNPAMASPKSIPASLRLIIGAVLVWQLKLRRAVAVPVFDNVRQNATSARCQPCRSGPLEARESPCPADVRTLLERRNLSRSRSAQASLPAARASRIWRSISSQYLAMSRSSSQEARLAFISSHRRRICSKFGIIGFLSEDVD